jgi:hypothetical protein
MDTLPRRLIALALLSVGLVACSNHSDDSDSGGGRSDEAAECIEPANPWEGQGGGHEAGFSWAEEKGYDCPSEFEHGQAFAEGCNEYYDQLRRYQECNARKHQ